MASPRKSREKAIDEIVPPEPPPCAPPHADLSDMEHIIIIRWDNDSGRPVVDLGGTHILVARAMLELANDQVWCSMPEAELRS